MQPVSKCAISRTSLVENLNYKMFSGGTSSQKVKLLFRWWFVWVCLLNLLPKVLHEFPLRFLLKTSKSSRPFTAQLYDCKISQLKQILHFWLHFYNRPIQPHSDGKKRTDAAAVSPVFGTNVGIPNGQLECHLSDRQVYEEVAVEKSPPLIPTLPAFIIRITVFYGRTRFEI